MQYQTFQRKPLAGDADIEVEKVKMQYKPKLIYTDLIHTALYFSFLSSFGCIYI